MTENPIKVTSVCWIRAERHSAGSLSASLRPACRSALGQGPPRVARRPPATLRCHPVGFGNSTRKECVSPQVVLKEPAEGTTLVLAAWLGSRAHSGVTYHGWSAQTQVPRPPPEIPCGPSVGRDLSLPRADLPLPEEGGSPLAQGGEASHRQVKPKGPAKTQGVAVVAAAGGGHGGT